MNRKKWAIAAPIFLAAAVIFVSLNFVQQRAIGLGISTGILIALLQTLVSIGAMKWAWNTKAFYWVWGAGFLARLIVLGVVAFVVYQFSDFSLVATLLSLVVGSTLFLTFESTLVFGNK